MKIPKGVITIENFLGGKYYFTSDEVRITKDTICLVEAKHSKNSYLPSEDDIKDGLIKMVLFTNLTNIRINNKTYTNKAILKLTSSFEFSPDHLNEKKKKFLETLLKEAETNNFEIIFK